MSGIDPHLESFPTPPVPGPPADPTGPTGSQSDQRPASSSRGRLAWTRLRTTRRFWVGAAIVTTLSVWALAGAHLSSWTLEDQDLVNAATAPNPTHWFGTDPIGHDVYVQTVSAVGSSMLIGLLAGPLGTLLAAMVGSWAGYVGGRTEVLIGWVINLMLVIPAFFLLMLLTPRLKGLSWVALVLVIPVFSWMIMAQVIRGQTAVLRHADFVTAARFMGVPRVIIIRRHILPNLASLLVIDATLSVVGAVMAETTLSYFGFGVQPPQVSLGTMLAAGAPSATTQPWVFAFPATSLVMLLFGVNLIGDALRDALDPKSRHRHG